MPREINSTADALSYMVDCTLATVDSLAMRKSPPKAELRRQCAIAQAGVDAMRRFGIPEAGNRSEQVTGTVVEYAEAIHARCHP